MKSLLFLFVTLIALSSFGQHQIKGHISDASGTLAFVNIIVKQSHKGAFSDENGNFFIIAKPTDTLQVSYLGYKTKTILIGEQTDLKIVLEDGYEELEAVILLAPKQIKTHCGTVCSFNCIYERENHSGAFELYPNPSKDGIFYLKMIQQFSEVNVLVADLSGRILLNKRCRKSNSNIVVDLSNQPSGIYIIKVLFNGEVITSKKAIRV